MTEENPAKEIEEEGKTEEGAKEDEDGDDKVSNEASDPEPQDSNPKPQDSEPHTTIEAESTSANISNGGSANDGKEASKTDTGPTILYKVCMSYASSIMFVGSLPTICMPTPIHSLEAFQRKVCDTDGA